MGKLIVFFVMVFLVIVGLLAFFNQGTIELTVWQNITYTVPVIALIMISAAFGILSMTIIIAVRDTRRYIESWQIQRQQKKEKKISESFSKGLEAYYAGRNEEASELFTHVIDDEPSHSDALMRLGDISFEAGDITKAKEYYLRARELKPRSIEVMLSLEKVSMAQNKWQEAMKYLDEILEIDPDNIHTLHKKRDIYEINNRWDELLEVQQKILKCKISEKEEQEENEKLLGYKYEMGKYYLQSGDIDKGVKNLKNIIKTEHHFSAAYLMLADVYLQNGNTKEAGDILLKGYEATSSLVFLAKLEEHYISEGEPGTIIDLYQKEIQKNQSDLRLQFLLAKLYYRLEMIDYAFDTINAIDISSLAYPELHALMGNIHERRSEFEKAIDEFKKALKIDKALLIPFCCSSCNYISEEWYDRCPECRNWNTYKLDINEVCKAEKRQSSS